MAAVTIGAMPAPSLRGQPGWPTFFVAATLARLSNEMLSVALVLLLLARTGRPALAGAVVAAATLPSVVSGPLLGAWLDRTARRRAALAANQALSGASLLAILVLAGPSPAWALLGLAAVAGAAAPLLTGGFTSMIPQLVPEELLGRANALEATSFNSAAIAGPALAGAVAASLGAGTAVGVEVLLAGAALGAIVRLPALVPPQAGAAGSLGRTLRDGLAHLARTPVLRGVTVTTALALGGQGLLTLALPFLAERLGAGRAGAGWLLAALEAGGIAGALAAARLLGRWPSERVVLAGVGVAGLVTMTWPLAPSFPAALGLLALAGLADGPAFAATFTTRQRFSPPRLRAQIFTTAASLKVGAFSVGAALAGPVVQHAGVDRALLAVGAVALLAVVAGALAGALPLRLASLAGGARGGGRRRRPVAR
jgi:predicted MFS family arabinose efflux permease